MTVEEAKVQKTVGGVEMGLGFAGVFFSGGQAVQAGALVMADGAIVFSGGQNNKKTTPALHLANDFLNPYREIPDSSAGYVSPLP